MDMFLQIGLSNALVAGVLALVAASVQAFANRPALVHSLWLLVLVKLVTPPLWLVPIKVLPAATSGPAVVVSLPAPEVSATPANSEPSSEGFDNRASEYYFAPAEAAGETTNETAAPAPTCVNQPAAPIAPPPTPFDDTSDRAVPLLALAWLAGSLGCLALTAIRVGRFQWLLKKAAPAPAELSAEVNGLARRLGLRRAPGVFLVPGPVSPMLWSLLGAARLLLPDGLLDKLDAEQRQTLLAHELAHLRRRDHWLRWLELLATGLYWWNPVVWWARRELRQAEEECCDAWVVWALPHSAKSYATALVETLDFLADARLALPPAASGIGEGRVLKRRVTMIMQGTTSRKLSFAGLLAVLGLAALLPLVPTWAQEEPQRRKELQEPGRKDVVILADPEANAEEIAKARANLKEAHERLMQAARRLAELEGKQVDQIKFFQLQVPPGVAPPGAPMPPVPPAGVRVQIPMGAGPGVAAFGAGEDADVLAAHLKIKEAQVMEAELRLQQGTQKLERVKQLAAKGGVSAEEVATATGDLQILKAQLAIKIAELEETKVRLDKARKRGAGQEFRGEIFTRPVQPSAVATAPVRPGVPATDSDRRLNDVEAKLKELLRELEGLRKDMRRPGDPGPRRPGSERGDSAPGTPAPPAPR